MDRLRRWLKRLPEFLTDFEIEALPDEINLVLLSAERIGQMHDQFMGDPTPTDVITFQHGDIAVCPEVAVQQCCTFGKSLEEETLLYIIHGVLHLAGFDDRDEVAAADMARRQEEVLAEVIASI